MIGPLVTARRERGQYRRDADPRRLSDSLPVSEVGGLPKRPKRVGFIAKWFRRHGFSRRAYLTAIALSAVTTLAVVASAYVEISNSSTKSNTNGQMRQP
jgi:hypothetical protein